MAHEGKLDKAVVLYMSKAEIDEGRFQGRKDKGPGARCGKCDMFIAETSKCVKVYKDNNRADTTVSGEMGVCGYYMGGPNLSKDHMVMPSVSRTTAGYQELGPTYCGPCEYYLGFSEDGPCRKVEGIVEHGGCCNHQEFGGPPRAILDVPLSKLGL